MGTARTGIDVTRSVMRAVQPVNRMPETPCLRRNPDSGAWRWRPPCSSSCRARQSGAPASLPEPERRRACGMEKRLPCGSGAAGKGRGPRHCPVVHPSFSCRYFPLFFREKAGVFPISLNLSHEKCFFSCGAALFRSSTSGHKKSPGHIRGRAGARPHRAQAQHTPPRKRKRPACSRAGRSPAKNAGAGPPHGSFAPAHPQDTR